jgi:hypothetical protein
MSDFGSKRTYRNIVDVATFGNKADIVDCSRIATSQNSGKQR